MGKPTGFIMTKISDTDEITGIKTTTHYLDESDKVIIQKEYNATPFLDMAAEMRAHTEGQKWGEMRHVGFVPMAELATMMRQDGTIDTKRAMAWIKANPEMATFSKVLK